MSRLALLHGSPSTSWRYFFEGIDLSMSLYLSYLGDVFHVVIALLFSVARVNLAAACLLRGSGFRNGAGKRRLLLDPFSVANLATLSASSFPVTPSWPGIHLMVIVIFLCRFLVISHLLQKISHMCCVGVARAVVERCMDPKLSAIIDMVVTLRSCLISSKPRISAVPAASGTVCRSADPSRYLRLVFLHPFR